MSDLPTPAEVARVLKRAHRRGGGWVACCPVHPDRIPSLSTWTGKDGRTRVKCHSGCDWRDVIAELQRLGVWPQDGEPKRPEPTPEEREELEHELREKAERAQRYWRESIPLWHPRAELGGRYLRLRGIAPPYPETLAFSWLCHPETHERCPCLLVARHGPDGHVVALQRIYLNRDGTKYAASYRDQDGTVRKAKAKWSLGCAPVSRLVFAYPLPHLAVAEGVETALSAWRIFDLPAWACCGGFPKELRLPDHCERVSLIADHDPSEVSEVKARALARSIRATGRAATVLMPNETGLDANDILKGASS